MRVWNWVKNESGEAELTIYGDITSERWWNSDVTLTDFYKEMREIGDVDKIVVRINSGGGEVNAAMGMYSLLKTNKAKIEVVIDGFAASAATLVAMAGDVIKIPKAAIFMIHDPSGVGRGTSEDFRKAADSLDRYKSCIVAAYAEKTGKTEEELSKMMSDESYMTGEEAVNEGFCDELIGEEADVMVNNRGIVFVNHVQAGKIPMKNKKTKEREEEEDMEIKNKEDLRMAYPSLVDEVRAEAAKEERERIKDIEEMTPPGFENMAAEAKFTNCEKPTDYMKKVVAEQRKQGESFLNNRRGEIKGSGADDVTPGGGAPGSGAVKNAFEKAFDAMEKRDEVKNNV